MGWLKESIFKLKVFLWYIITEPFRQMHDFFYYLSETLNKITSWIYVFITVAIIALTVGQRWVASIFMIILLLIILVWEWQSGFFMFRYREKEKKRIEKKLNQEGGNKDGGLDSNSK
jgi:hypothetical protein